ncbi:MAG: hypothetical protein MJZ25_02755 [Fibrobacter sp.]|nr:hypothetical protein [Fibrobacter sp.]
MGVGVEPNVFVLAIVFGAVIEASGRSKLDYEVRELDAETETFGSYDDKHHVHAQVRCVKE